MRSSYAIRFECPRCADAGLFRFGKVHRYRCGFCEFEFEKAIARKVRVAEPELSPQEAAAAAPPRERRLSGCEEHTRVEPAAS